MHDNIQKEINDAHSNGKFSGTTLERVWLPEMNIEFAQKWKAKKDDKAKKHEATGELQMVENSQIKDYRFGELETSVRSPNKNLDRSTRNINKS